jgi:Ca2+-binding EF-hand superfamily protein
MNTSTVAQRTRLFNFVDTNNDGRVTKDEIMAFSAKMGDATTEEDA